MSAGATWTWHPARGFAFVADASARITWSFSSGEFVLLVPPRTHYEAMPAGGALRRRGGRIGVARPESAAKAGGAAQAAKPERAI